MRFLAQEEAAYREEVHSAVLQVHADLLGRQALFHALGLKPGDGGDLVPLQGIEHDEVVDAVDELGPEVAPHLQHAWMINSSSKHLL